MPHVKSILLNLFVLVMLSGTMMGALGADGSANQTLKIAMVPSDDIEEMVKAFGPMETYLENELGVDIETYAKVTDYTSVIEAMRSKKIDAAFFGPLSYVQAAKEADARAIVAGGNNTTGQVGGYYSLIIANKDSGLTSIDDLKARVGEINFAFVDPASTSGNLVPRGYLRSIGIDPSKDFKEVMFAGGHDAVGLAVQSGKVEAGAMYDKGYNRMVESGALDPEKVIILAKSAPIPSSPFAVRGDLDPVLIDNLQKAFLEMPTKDPEAFQSFEAMWEKNSLYVAVNDSTYDDIREAAIGEGLL